MLHAMKNEPMTHTENGALTHASTGSACLDLFAAAGALRNASRADILRRFKQAWQEDRDLAVRILFFARDVRGGLGERQTFRTILSHLAGAAPGTVRKNLSLVAEYGRWDDLLCLLGTPCHRDAVRLIEKQLQADLAAMEAGGSASLLAKWLPSVNASCAETVRQAKRLAAALGMSQPEYRRTLSRLRAYLQILENDLRRKDYTFDYEKQPSQAMLKYRGAFFRHDEERYTAYLDRVRRGEANLHTGTLYPYQVVGPLVDRRCEAYEQEKRIAAQTTWEALEDFTQNEKALVVMDGSGSMYGGSEPQPITVALSLAIYFAERCDGPFKNHFITFSQNPRLVEIKGEDIWEKVQCCTQYGEVANTDLERVFRLILATAQRHKLAQEQLPDALYIITDMEFDRCTENAGLTNFEQAKLLFEKAGYKLPRVVFWNVCSRNTHQPVRQNEQGVALVSGASPRVFETLRNGTPDPMSAMLAVLNSERYADIAA